MRTLAAIAAILALSITALAQDKPGYQPPADAAFTTEEVSIPGAVAEDEKAWNIAASLNLPKGEMPEGGWPAVFLVSGSGMQDRHGMAGTDLGTWEVLDAVANAGFAVLRADDRTKGGTPLGPEGFDPAKLGYHELVSDARQCVNWLRAHEKVNKDKVFVIGHSEGGLTAEILATEGLCAGIVSMAGMGRNMYDIIYEQVGDANAGNPKATRDANLKVQKEFQDAVKEGREPDFNILGAGSAPQLKRLWNQQIKPAQKWFNDHFNLDVPAIHAKVKCPVFVAQGEADFQVKTGADAKQLAKNLLAGECRDLTLKIYPDLDHLFKSCSGRKSTAAIYKEDRRVNETYLKDLTAWLKARA